MLELWKCHLITAGYRGSADLGLASLGLIYFWKVKRSDSFNIKNVENTEHYEAGKIMVPGVYSPMVLAPSVMAIKISASAFIFEWDTDSFASLECLYLRGPLLLPVVLSPPYPERIPEGFSHSLYLSMYRTLIQVTVAAVCTTVLYLLYFPFPQWLWLLHFWKAIYSTDPKHILLKSPLAKRNVKNLHTALM